MIFFCHDRPRVGGPMCSTPPSGHYNIFKKQFLYSTVDSLLGFIHFQKDLIYVHIIQSLDIDTYTLEKYIKL